GNIIVGYDNGNVDIIMPDRTLNMPGIRNNENILDSKKINDILVIKNLIFLATDFGIVEIDGEKYEFGSTLFTDDAVLQMTDYDGGKSLIGRTKNELFVLQDLENSNLADIHQWEIYPPDRPGEITDMAVGKEELYLVIAERLYRSSHDGQTEEITVTNWEVMQIKDGNIYLLVTNEFSNIILWNGERDLQHNAPCVTNVRDVLMVGEEEFWYVTKREFGRYD